MLTNEVNMFKKLFDIADGYSTHRIEAYSCLRFWKILVESNRGGRRYSLSSNGLLKGNKMLIIRRVTSCDVAKDDTRE